MKIRLEQLNNELQKKLLPVYLVSGDELLLVQESCDAIRACSRQQGIEEREVLEAERNFDWQQLLEAGQSMSLFGERKLIELRMGKAAMNQKSSAALQQYLDLADGSNILLISCGRLDSRSMNSKWVKAIDKIGATIQVWPVERQHLGNWILHRLKEQGLTADREAAELLADRVEGNLLAADQEIRKLKVLVGERTIDAETVASAVASSARYDVFKLIDATLAGNAALALQMLNSLLAEGSEEIAMLGAISREVRNLYECARQIENGHNLDRVLDQARVWDKRKALYKNALRRLNTRKLAALLQQATAIDAAQKGQSDDDAGLLLSSLVTTLANR